jgi:hypothetical protein
MDPEFYQHLSVTLAFIRRLLINLHEAVKEEIATAAKEAGFQDVIDDIIELLESHYLSLTNEELAESDRQT